MATGAGTGSVVAGVEHDVRARLVGAGAEEGAGTDGRGGSVDGDSVRSVTLRAEGTGGTEHAGSGARAGRSGVGRRARAVGVRVAAVRGVGAPLRGHAGYLVAAVGAFITLVLMTRPWLVATGANGTVESTAFGRIDASTKYLTVWSKSSPETPKVSGLLAFTTSAVIVLTICLAVLYFRMRSPYFARLVAGSSVAVAILVLFTMLYLDSKGAELKALTERKYDLGGQVGQLLSWVKGNGKFILPGASQGQYVATSRFTPSAVAAATVAVVSALAAVTQWLLARGVEPGGLKAKVSALREKWDAAGRAVAAQRAAAERPAADSGGLRADPRTEPATAEFATAQADSTGTPAPAESGRERPKPAD